MRNLRVGGMFMTCGFWTGLLVLFSVMPSFAWADGLISCKYLKAAGHDIELELEVRGGAPLTVIVLQHLPAGVNVVGSRPAMKKYEAENGLAKWLLKNVKPGKSVVSIKLDKAVKPGDIKGELRYRTPDSGVMEEMMISP